MPVLLACVLCECVTEQWVWASECVICYLHSKEAASQSFASLCIDTLLCVQCAETQHMLQSSSWEPVSVWTCDRAAPVSAWTWSRCKHVSVWTAAGVNMWLSEHTAGVSMWVWELLQCSSCELWNNLVFSYNALGKVLIPRGFFSHEFKAGIWLCRYSFCHFS